MPSKPNPGSDEAFVIGCTCARIDNAYGRGAYRDANGEPQFWVASNCPIHAETVATIEHSWDHKANGPVKIVRPTE